MTYIWLLTLQLGITSSTSPQADCIRAVGVGKGGDGGQGEGEDREEEGGKLHFDVILVCWFAGLVGWLVGVDVDVDIDIGWC